MGITESQNCMLCNMDTVSLVWEEVAMSDALHMSHSALLGLRSTPWGECRCSQVLEMNTR